MKLRMYAEFHENKTLRKFPNLQYMKEDSNAVQLFAYWVILNTFLSSADFFKMKLF